MSTDIAKRKSEHITLAQNEAMQMHSDNGLSNVRFEPIPLPELNINDIDTSLIFMEKRLHLPLIIASMSGGTKQSQQLNETLAKAAEEKAIALGLGSMRIAIENDALKEAFTLRHIAPTAVILANLGATQLREKNGVYNALKCVDIAQADGLIIHLNPLQELIQSGGDKNWQGVASQIDLLVKSSPCPIMVKEVGHGIGPTTIRLLHELGIRYIDIAGAGGTSWAGIETARSSNEEQARIGQVFHNFGITLAESLMAIRLAPEITKEVQLTASGGIRSGLDMAKALRLGATTVAAATPFLKAALESEKCLMNTIDEWHEQLKITCMVTASQNIEALKTAPLI